MGEMLTVGHLTTREIRRIFAKVEINPMTKCWEWTAYLLRGYGRVRFRGRMEAPHRILYVWVLGPIPRGLGRDIPQIDHVVCDNPKCCNPSHLQLVPARVNILRGNGPTAQNARRLTCKRSHSMPDVPNIQVGKKWIRRCVICHIEDKKEYHQMKMNGPDADTYKAKRLAQSRKDAQTARRKEYARNYAKCRRNGPNRAQILEKDRLSQQTRRRVLREAANG